MYLFSAIQRNVVIINLFSFKVDLFQNVNVNNGTLVQYLVIERVICFYILRLQELKQKQELAFVSQ